MSERQTQIAICDFIRRQWPFLDDYLIKIDNEGKRNVIVRNGQVIPIGNIIAKRMGLRPKASDLFIAWPTIEYSGLWMEIKPDAWPGPKGKKEKAHVEGQLKFQAMMRAVGYQTAWCVGVEQGIDAIKAYMKSG